MPYPKLFGFETFRIVNDSCRKSVVPTDVDRAYANLSDFNRDQYEQLMLTLSTSQKKLLIALAHERTDEFGDAYRRRHALGVSSMVNSAKTKLMEDGHIELYDGRYTIADPFSRSFSAWCEVGPRGGPLGLRFLRVFWRLGAVIAFQQWECSQQFGGVSPKIPLLRSDTAKTLTWFKWLPDHSARFSTI